VDAGDLAADPGTHLGGEVVVTGEWVTAGPCADGYMVVHLRGRRGGDVACHFERVPAADRGRLESRLAGSAGVEVLGRCGVEGGTAAVRGCRLLD
jgi:hypothetical protein